MTCRAKLSSENLSLEPITALIIAADAVAATVDLQPNESDVDAAKAILRAASSDSRAMVHLHVAQSAPLCTRFKLQNCELDPAVPQQLPSEIFGSIGLEDLVFATSEVAMPQSTRCFPQHVILVMRTFLLLRLVIKPF